MANLRFNYFYRDADNYKLFGSEVFLNKERLDVRSVTALIMSALIDGQYFYPSEWGLPLLCSDDGWGMEGADWCEFEGVEETEEEVTMGSIRDWLKKIGARGTLL